MVYIHCLSYVSRLMAFSLKFMSWNLKMNCMASIDDNFNQIELQSENGIK